MNTENNKLIAEFMGFKKDIYFHFPQHKELVVSRDGYSEWMEHFRADELKYHSSWDWLIPVVESIEQTNLATIEIHTKGMVLISYNSDTLMYTDSLITAVYDACVDFIKWYNKNNYIK